MSPTGWAPPCAKREAVRSRTPTAATFILARPTQLREIKLHLVHKAPAPLLPWLHRPHNRMLRPMKVLRRMFVRRRIAAAHMPADHAHSQMHPPPTNLQAVLASLRRRRHILDLIQ